MPLDYNELRRRLEQRPTGEQKPKAEASPAARRQPVPAAPTRRATTEPRPDMQATQRRRAPLPPRPPVELFAALVTAVFVLPGVALFLVARGVEPVLSFPYQFGGTVGVVVGTIYTLIVMRVLTRYGEPRSTAAGLGGPVAIAVIAVIASSLIATGVATILNARLDKGPVSVERLMVLEKARIPGANARSTRVTVPLWTDVGVHLQFLLPDTLYDQIEPRRTELLVRTRAGAFGWQWIEDASEVAAIQQVEAAPAAVVEAAPPAPPTGAAVISEENRAEARQILEQGLAAMRAGRRDNALNDFKRAIDIDPWFTFAYRELEKVLVANQDYDEMADYWGRLIETNKSSKDGHWGRARMRLAKNDRVNALDDADQACKLGHIPACQLVEKLRTETGR